MTTLQLYTEQFGPNGNVAAEGVINQLGRPSLDIHSLLIRETVQNSWDARLLDWGDVRFSIDVWTPTQVQRSILRDRIFAQLPDALPLADVLDEKRLSTDDPDYLPALKLLAISDRGTKGLGGPTRADRPSRPGEPRDFVDFLRNVGLPPDKPMTGGTYGYGKAASYLASRARTIIVYTRWMSPGGAESRLQPAALGTSHVTTTDGPLTGIHTGRYWWGRLSEDFVEPITGDEADELAAALGLQVMFGEETGTTVCIVDPYLAGASTDETVSWVVSALLWNFWPKMIPDAHGRLPISFSVSSDGQAVPIPDPRSYPPLDGFVAALETLERGDDLDDGMTIAQQVRQIRPARTLGRLAVRKYATQPRTGVGASRPPAPFEGPSHHVALMRPVRLVVRYQQGPRLEIDAVQYAGVFVVDEGVDEIFKAAEPPTHDDWKDSLLQSRNDRSAVHVAEQRIEAALDRMAAPPDDPRGGQGGGTVAGLAQRMAWILPGLTGPGVEVRDQLQQRQTRSRKPRARVLIKGQRGPILLDGGPAIEISCEVAHIPGSEGTLIAAKARIALDEGVLETDPPEGAPSPAVKYWLAPDGTRVAGDRVWVPADSTGAWRVMVGAVPDLMVGVEIEPVSG